MEDIYTQVEQLENRCDLIEKLNLALTHLVVALALSRFDIIELPITIRSLFDDQKTSRSGGDEQNRVLRLASELRDKATSIMTTVEIAINEPEGSALTTNTSLNKPENKIYLIS